MALLRQIISAASLREIYHLALSDIESSQLLHPEFMP